MQAIDSVIAFSPPKILKASPDGQSQSHASFFWQVVAAEQGRDLAGR
jgi:hypothetical protein